MGDNNKGRKRKGSFLAIVLTVFRLQLVKFCCRWYFFLPMITTSEHRISENKFHLTVLRLRWYAIVITSITIEYIMVFFVNVPMAVIAIFAVTIV